jgi:hypothetical protein
MDVLVDLTLAGIGRLATVQREALAPTMEEVDAVLARGRRRPAPAKDEADLWGAP